MIRENHRNIDSAWYKTLYGSLPKESRIVWLCNYKFTKEYEVETLNVNRECFVVYRTKSFSKALKQAKELL